MPQASRRAPNMLGLAVLGLLLERPMHPYEMATTLLERNKGSSFKIRRASLYDVVANLETKGWIEAQGTERAGNRPERTVYTQTDLGRKEFDSWLDELVRRPRQEYPSFLAAVGYLGALGPERAVDALTERGDHLGQQVEAMEKDLRAAREKDVPRLFMIEIEFAIATATAERDWVRAIAQEISEGALPWPNPADRDGADPAQP